MSQFQLFPPPSPEVKAAKNPFRRGVKKPPVVKVEPASPISLNEIKDSAKAESVLLQIIEDTSSFPPPPSQPLNTRSKSPSVAETSPSSKSSQSPRSRSRQENKSPARVLQSQGSASTSSSSSNHTTSSTASPQSSQSSVSPVPMRSMFPRFEPKLPLNNQTTRSPMPRDDKPSKKSRRPQLTLATSSEIDHVLGPKTVPASVLNFPNGVSDSEEIRYSTPYELEMLWEAANGQRPQNLAGAFNLHMTRYLVPKIIEYSGSLANSHQELVRRLLHLAILNSRFTPYRLMIMMSSQSREELHVNLIVMYLS